MTWQTWTVIILGSLGVLCLAAAWSAHCEYTRELDRLGVVYGCKRWPEENNRSYHHRIRARVEGHFGGGIFGGRKP